MTEKSTRVNSLQFIAEDRFRLEDGSMIALKVFLNPIEFRRMGPTFARQARKNKSKIAREASGIFEFHVAQDSR